jgi:hypothetical protein
VIGRSSAIVAAEPRPRKNTYHDAEQNTGKTQQQIERL